MIIPNSFFKFRLIITNVNVHVNLFMEQGCARVAPGLFLKVAINSGAQSKQRFKRKSLREGTLKRSGSSYSLSLSLKSYKTARFQIIRLLLTR